MSQRYKGAVITATPPVPTPGNAGTAPGLWTMQQQLQAQGAGTWPSFTPVYVEEVFSTYLYTGNGGKQTVNNGILLGSGQVGTGGSQFFDGNLGRVNMPDSSLFTLGTSWCIEAFIYPVASQTGTIFARWYSPTNNAAYVFYFDGYLRGGAYPYYNSAGGPVTLNQWSHVAMTYNGSVKRFFVNGTLVASYTEDDSITSTTGQSPSIGNNTSGGAPFPGYISNLRVVSGSPVYTSSFTVPTSPLTAISGTSLLCLQGTSPLIDNSGNNVILTSYNGTNYSSNGPFDATTVAGKGGLVWIKGRSVAGNNIVTDTVRGPRVIMQTNQTAANYTGASETDLYSFNPTGFSLGTDDGGNMNSASQSFVSWTFRKEPKFFDVVTWTGDGTSNRQISHSLGSVPGCIIVKGATNTGSWTVYHRSIGATKYILLNSTASESVSSLIWNDTSPTSTNFTVGGSAFVNASGVTYIAYVFAHNAGGFGLNGTDNIITCGSYTGNGTSSGPVTTLGYEPQWLMVKKNDPLGTTGPWLMYDTTRGMPDGYNAVYTYPNTSDVEGGSSWGRVRPLATGFQPMTSDPWLNENGMTYIYVAIRRGPMRLPTSASQVFETDVSLNSTFPYAGASFPPDVTMFRGDRSATNNFNLGTRLLGAVNLAATAGGLLRTNLTNAAVDDTSVAFDSSVGSLAWSSTNPIVYSFRRAPGYADVVCYTGTGATLSVSHNLGVVPELIIFKRRDSAASWPVWRTATGTGTSFVYLNDSSGDADQGVSILTATPTSTAMSVGAWGAINGSGGTYVAYLFASCPGVSKVGSYTGTGATQTISCGFAARFVLIKRTDSTGNWWVWDAARGMVAGTDPRLAFNVTDAESNANWVYTNASGFQIVTTDATVNASGGSYIYLAIA